MNILHYILGVSPTHDASEIIICSFLWRAPYKPALSTVGGLGIPPNYINLFVGWCVCVYINVCVCSLRWFVCLINTAAFQLNSGRNNSKMSSSQIISLVADFWHPDTHTHTKKNKKKHKSSLEKGHVAGIYWEYCGWCLSWSAFDSSNSCLVFTQKDVGEQQPIGKHKLTAFCIQDGKNPQQKWEGWGLYKAQKGMKIVEKQGGS